MVRSLHQGEGDECSMSDERAPLPDQYLVLQDVVDQAVGLFHILQALAEQLHEQGELTAGRRGILQSLDRIGPQTVPQLARARPVSRQHIQMEVNQLEADELVELIDNIAHKRSRLVRLTSQGKASLEAMYRREAAFYTTLEIAIPKEVLRSTAETLSALRELFLHAQLRLARGTEQTAPASSQAQSENE
jgi:DNA-binding MarR family transcriptional regulator